MNVSHWGELSEAPVTNTHPVSLYWLPPRKPYLSVRLTASPLISESEPMELPSSPRPDRDSSVPDIRLADSR